MLRLLLHEGARLCPQVRLSNQNECAVLKVQEAATLRLPERKHACRRRKL